MTTQSKQSQEKNGLFFLTLSQKTTVTLMDFIGLNLKRHPWRGIWQEVGKIMNLHPKYAQQAYRRLSPEVVVVFRAAMQRRADKVGQPLLEKKFGGNWGGEKAVVVEGEE